MKIITIMSAMLMWDRRSEDIFNLSCLLFQLSMASLASSWVACFSFTVSSKGEKNIYYKKALYKDRITTNNPPVSHVLQNSSSWWASASSFVTCDKSFCFDDILTMLLIIEWFYSLYEMFYCQELRANIFKHNIKVLKIGFKNFK